MPIASGRLSRKITVQSVSRSANAFGEMEETWSDASPANAWAEIRPVTAREYIAGKGVVGEVTHRITLRYRSDIDQDSRILYVDSGRTRYFEIVGLIDIMERHEVLEIVAKERE